MAIVTKSDIGRRVRELHTGVTGTIIGLNAYPLIMRDDGAGWYCNGHGLICGEFSLENNSWRVIGDFEFLDQSTGYIDNAPVFNASGRSKFRVGDSVLKKPGGRELTVSAEPRIYNGDEQRVTCESTWFNDSAPRTISRCIVGRGGSMWYALKDYGNLVSEASLEFAVTSSPDYAKYDVENLAKLSLETFSLKSKHSSSDLVLIKETKSNTKFLIL